MALTASATLLAKYKSSLSGGAGGAGSLVLISGGDVVTVVHLLPTTPDTVYAILRSVNSSTSGFVITLALTSANASQFVMTASTNVGTVAGTFDIVAAFEHSIVR